METTVEQFYTFYSYDLQAFGRQSKTISVPVHDYTYWTAYYNEIATQLFSWAGGTLQCL